MLTVFVMFQAIEMIKQVETEAQNETKHVTKKTHKGEVEVDEEGEEDMSALADEVKLVNGFEHLCNSYIRILPRNYGITYINALQNRCYMCNPWTRVIILNIGLKLRNKLHGPMHYKIGVTCVFN